MAERFNTAEPLVWEDLVTDIGTRARYPLGMVRHEDGKEYGYVKYDNGTANLAAIVGNICYLINATDHTVTMDVSDADRNQVYGVFTSIPADAGFAWVQAYGPNADVKTDGGDDIADGDFIIAAAGDGVVDRMIAGTAPTHRVVGVATADDSATGVAAFLLMKA